MTNERFDELTKAFSKTASRRTIVKGVVAAAVDGVLTRFRGGGDAEARARIKMACARLGQPCNTVPGTPGNQICCPHLVCDTDLTCCKPEGENCLQDGDCCAGDVCRPNAGQLGMHCLPLGLLGEQCVNDADCASSLGCDTYTGTCETICDGETCTKGQICCGDPYVGTVCCGSPNLACDQQLPACVGCAEYDEPCNSDAECCDNLRDGNAICGALPTDSGVAGEQFGILETSGVCCVPVGGACAVGPCCAGAFCNSGEVCEAFS